MQSKRIYPEDGCGPTLSSGTGEGMNIQPSVMQPTCFKYAAGAAAGTMPTYDDGSTPTIIADYHNPAVAMQTGHTKGNGSGFNEENVSYTVGTSNDQAVVFAQNTRDEVRMVGGDGSMSGAVQAQPGKNQTYVMTNYGEEIAGTLTARADSSACADRGQNIVCMSDDTQNAAVDVDLSGTLKVGGGSPFVAMRQRHEQ